MDWDLAIKINSAALSRLLTVMFAALGVEDGGSVETVQERVRLMVLRLLGPAESAVRRLIFLTARDLPKAEYERGSARGKSTSSKTIGSKTRAIRLFDPRKPFGNKQHRTHPKGAGPRIWFMDGSDPNFTQEPDKPLVSPDDLVSADNLCRRLNGLWAALNDLDKQAKRLKRAEARRALSARLRLQGVLRINTAPGHRKRGRSADERVVDDILTECQSLARLWLHKLNSS